MKTIILAAVILFSGVKSVIGSSFVNPWHEVKVSLRAKKGEKAEKVLKEVMDAAKGANPLQYELYFSKSKMDFGEMGSATLDADINVKDREIGIAFSDLARSLKCGLIISENAIAFVPVKTADVRYDLFYLVPESLKSSEKTEEGLRSLIEASEPAAQEKATITFDVKLRMVLLRADRLTHEKIGKLLKVD